MTVNAGTAAAGTYSVTVTASGGGLSATANLSLTVTASGGGVVVLSNGQTVSNLSGASSSWSYYKIAVPANQSQFEINLRAPEGTSLQATELIANRVAAARRSTPQTS